MKGKKVYSEREKKWKRKKGRNGMEEEDRKKMNLGKKVSKDEKERGKLRKKTGKEREGRGRTRKWMEHIN